jgi:hypothetical protein
MAKWTMTAPNGLNKKKRKRLQTMLRGRGCRVHTGQCHHRGPGRTAHGRRG